MADWLETATHYGPLVAGIGVAAGYFQFLGSRSFQRKQRAFDVYNHYLEMAYKEPRFAEPDKYGTPNDEKEGGGYDERYSEYEWFVSLMLNACEAVIDSFVLFRLQKTWRTTIKDQVGRHLAYLGSRWFRETGQWDYSKTLREMIDDTLRAKRKAGQNA
ncbi:MAG TPA: hypothetical protein VFV07_03510 [Rhizomicrobium sp.]|nr:hypothetical protein [Rhizomicrobium sp.]